MVSNQFECQYIQILFILCEKQSWSWLNVFLIEDVHLLNIHNHEFLFDKKCSSFHENMNIHNHEFLFVKKCSPFHENMNIHSHEFTYKISYHIFNRFRFYMKICDTSMYVCTLYIWCVVLCSSKLWCINSGCVFVNC